jgi:GrpB-like predicted nucleotidyltransferase (UPF0157 family)
MRLIALVEYSPDWAKQFEQLRQSLWPRVSAVAVRIEHVGSTAVTGLPAKPAIDLGILVEGKDQLLGSIERLAGLGYQHRVHLGPTRPQGFQVGGGATSFVCLSPGRYLNSWSSHLSRLPSKPFSRCREIRGT